MLLVDFVCEIRRAPVISALLGVLLGSRTTLRYFTERMPPGCKATLRKYFVYWPFFFS